MCQIALPMPESLDIQPAVQVHKPHFAHCGWWCAVVAGTHLIVDALLCPYRIGEQVRASKLRAVTQGMLLMWGELHSYTRMQATLATGCDCLGRDSSWNIAVTSRFYRHAQSHSSSYSWLSGYSTWATPFLHQANQGDFSWKEYLCAPTRLVNSYSAIDKTWKFPAPTLYVTPALKFIYSNNIGCKVVKILQAAECSHPYN